MGGLIIGALNLVSMCSKRRNNIDFITSNWVLINVLCVLKV